jgi:hypothetical protein
MLWIKNFIGNFFCKTMPIVILFILILLAGAMGQVARWDMLDQISMADNYAKNGSLYPSATSAEPAGVSVYFPGVALLAVLLNKIGINFYLVEVMILIACTIVILFLSIQKVLAREISGVKGTWSEFTLFAISVSLIITPHWLSYAREFKPDTIAFLLGFFGLTVASFLKSDTNIYKVLFGSILCSAALFFKQQYIAFIFGLIIFCILNPNKVRIYFLIGLCFFSTCILLYFYLHSNLWFWNVIVLLDDGFIPLKSVIADNYTTIISLSYTVFLSIVFFRIINKNQKNSSNNLFNFKDLKINFQRSPWIWVAIPSVLGAFAGALKAGGNSGNTQFGLILLLPLAFVLFPKIDRWIMLGIAWIAIFSSLPNLYIGPKVYLEAAQLRDFVVRDLPNKPSFILTGSDVYFASRVYLENSKVVNYWTLGSRDGSDTTEVLKNTLLKMQPDRLVVENWPANKAAIIADSRYELVYENKLGLIASLCLTCTKPVVPN